MPPAKDSLWEAIDGFRLDAAHVSFPFSARLARDNGWTREFAERVVEEYKRFAYLAMVAGHPVTPSDQVDQAWHLHLTYTRSYWEEFCGKVLPRPLHHEPTKGGQAEGRKFDGWYGRTLQSYRDHFGEEPPADIWPTAAVRFGDDVHFVRVNQRRHWIVPKPVRLGRWARLLTVPALASLLLGCTSATAMMAVFPFDLRGPEFLGFFGLFVIAVFLGAWWTRRRLLAPRRLPRGFDVDSLTSPEIALLAGGIPRASAALLGPLLQQGAISVDETNGSITAVQPPGTLASPAERSLWQALDPAAPTPLTDVESRTATILGPAISKLEQLGLIVPPEARVRAKMIPLVICALIPFVGSIKIAVGLVRDKPVGFLVTGTIFSCILAAAFFLRGGRRSGAAEELLDRLRVRHADLETPSAKLKSLHSQASTALPMAVALFGTGALANAGLFPLENAIERRSASGGGGCSSSGDAGGCGGGCGGGGCGGCGS